MSGYSVEELREDLLDEARSELRAADAERTESLSEGRRESARYHVARAQVLATMAAALR